MNRRTMTLSLGCALATLLFAVIAGGAMAAPPANDNFANATVISSFPFSDTVDVTDATVEPGEPQFVCGFVLQSVWYAFTPASDTVLSAVGIGGTSGPVSVSVFLDTGGGIGGLSPVTCGTFSNPLAFKAQAGKTYYFQVWPPFGGAGTVTLNVNVVPPPANDNFANATPVTALPFSTTADLTAATTEAGEPSPSCGQQPQETVWFAFTPSASGPYTLNLSFGPFSPDMGVYTGASLESLVQVACSTFFSPLTFHADAGTTYYLQIGAASSQAGSTFVSLEVTPPPVAQFGWNPIDPSVFDTVQFNSFDSDPVGVGFGPDHWSFGDGATAIGAPGGCCPPPITHRYAADGDYTVKLVATTLDGRTASVQNLISVRTHDVSIAKFTVPQSAQSGQTRSISVGVTDSRYPEMVRVDLYESSPSGFQPVGSLTQSVPVRDSNRTTPFDFSYTFTSNDAALGAVTFRADATIIGARDAIPGDNEVIALPTKVTH